MFVFPKIFETLDADSLDVQDDLDRSVWDEDDRLKPELTERLEQIAQDFIKKLGLDKFDIHDIVLTGSLAAYNWSKYSDFDLHIIFDFSQVDPNVDLVRDFLNARKSVWNRNHQIYLGDYEVELYFENRGDPHESPGIYSIKHDRWVTKPPATNVKVDKENAVKKAESLVHQIEDAERMLRREDFEEARTYATRIKDKIKKMRQSGLQKRGVYSVENLAFKLLRRSGDIEKLIKIINDSYDKEMSLKK
jgi:hypothetical protein